MTVIVTVIRRLTALTKQDGGFRSRQTHRKWNKIEISNKCRDPSWSTMTDLRSDLFPLVDPRSSKTSRQAEKPFLLLVKYRYTFLASRKFWPNRSSRLNVDLRWVGVSVIDH